jgi:hypothetical protein
MGEPNCILFIHYVGIKGIDCHEKVVNFTLMGNTEIFFHVPFTFASEKTKSPI